MLIRKQQHTNMSYSFGMPRTLREIWNKQSNSAAITSLQTTDMLKLCVSLGSIFNFMSRQHCACALVRFRHNNHLVRVHENIMFWLKITN